MSEFDKSEITREKTLWDVYKLCRRLPRRRSRGIIELATALLLCVYVVLSGESVPELAARVRSWAAAGFSLSIGILGFLVAGFAIFATMTRRDLAVAMAEKIHEESGLSYLKYNFAAFMDVFIKYLLFVGFYFFLVLFAHPSGLVSLILDALPKSEAARWLCAAAGIVAVGAFLVHLLLLLWAFVFNVYHVVMTEIRWEAEREEQER